MLDEKNEHLPNSEEETTQTPTSNIESTEVETPVEQKTEEEVVNEIEADLAEASEKDNGDHQEIDVLKDLPDYGSMDLEALANSLEKLLKEHSVQKINSHVNAIKSSFNSQFSKILAEKKAAFLAEGGESIDFSYSNPNKVKFNKLYNEFRDKRTKYFKELDTQLKDNLDLRVALIEQLKDLIINADPKTMYNKFRDIQERWKKIGPVAREKYNDTWRTYHHHVERFYDLLHMSNDFRDLDFKHNLEEKLKLIDRVEALADHKDINYAFKQLQVLHKMWKEDIGPVAREHRESVWGRFSSATKKIHDRRHDYFKGLRSKYEENIVKKLEVITEINNYDASSNRNHNDWQKSIKEIEGLREKFFKVGQVPKSETEKIWQQFKEATRKFNKEKNAFYKNVKSEQQENLNKKMKLIELAESYKDSEDWEEVTEVMKKIQSDWKRIGHVPRKYSDKIWKRFKDACNHYFDRFHQYKNQGSSENQVAFTKKKDFIENLKAQSESKTFTLDEIKELSEQWGSLGVVSHSARHIEGKFTKLIDKLYSSLDLDKAEREMIKFKVMVEGYLAQKNYRKLDGEQLFIRKKVDETVREIQQLENNMSFFSNTDSNNPLLKNVMQSIEEHRQSLDIYKQKLSYISHLEY
ncbi:DUF349 domain-containing protein [Urechidicola sp. KH5]